MSLPSSPDSIITQSSIYGAAPYVDITLCSIAWNDNERPTDADLYNHYLQHTSRTITLFPEDRCALQIEMPKLALQSKPVFHSLLAVSAACLCHDMISKEPASDTSTVSRILMTGYRHFNLASERIRVLISSPCSLTPGSLLASAVLLVPFATASQQINHWISSKSKGKESSKLLSTTPRDAIIIMRAIRTTLQTLQSDSSKLTCELSQEVELASDSQSTKRTIPQTATLAPSRTHVMVPILTATVKRAFTRLQQSLDSALLDNDDSEGFLPACRTALEVLKHITSKTFPTSDISSISSSQTKEPFKPESAPLSQVPPWLRSLAGRARDPLPTEPLTSFLLSFLRHSPQAYLDFVLPLLDQRLERPINAISNVKDLATEITREQTLALDIYAHWSVLMFLVKEDSWWIGDLPAVTLKGMINRYGDDFATRLWSGQVSSQEPWWPGSMLSILREIQRYQ